MTIMIAGGCKLRISFSFLALFAGLQLAFQLVSPAEGSSNEQSLSVINRLLRSFQSSACDGEQLHIECPADYSIFMIKAELTVVGQSLNETRVNQTDSNGSQHICPELSADQASARTKMEQTFWTKNETCSEQTSMELEADKREQQLMSLVEHKCHLLSSCTLDLRYRSEPGRGSISSPGAAVVAANSTRLLSLLAETCPGKRKLLELVYKCRPRKQIKRVACRGSQLQLECPADKRILLFAADYGITTLDLRQQEKCQQDWMSKRPESGTSPTSPPEAARNCTASPSTFGAVSGQCLGRSYCKLDVDSSTLGEPNCPAGLVEYVRVWFICLNESLAHPSLPAYTARFQRPQPDFISTTNVNSSSLLLSATNLASSSGSKGSRTGSVVTQSSASQSVESAEPSTSPSMFTVVSNGNSQPSLAAQPSQWSATQRVRQLLNRYQPQVMLVCMLAGSLVLVGLLIRVCRQGSDSRNSTTSSRDSKESNCSSTATKSSTGFKSFGSSANSASANNHNQHQPAGQKHNSCSESCFSLDDYHLLPASANHSPATLEADNTFNQHQARPKLWTIYQNEPRAHLNQHQTLRATRTFVAQPQPPQLRPYQQCLHETVNQQQDAENQQQTDMLLAMATGQHQHQPPGSGQNNQWQCQSLQLAAHQSAPANSLDRLGMLMSVNSPNELQPDPSRPPMATHCSFHSQLMQQQHQQQPQLIFAPPSMIELELPQSASNLQAANATLAPPQQQQHQQLNQSQTQNQQQQLHQSSNTLRLFH